MNKYIILFLIITGDIIAQNINENGYNVFKYGNGIISSEGFLINGKPNGYWKTYYTNGVIKSEGNRKHFLLDSIWIFYNENKDTVEVLNYFEGKKNGYCLSYYADSTNTIKSKELYINNSKEGKSFYYYRNSSIQEIINYKNNKKHGLSYEFSIDNNIIAVYEYHYNRLVNSEIINRYNKNLLKEGLWRSYYNDFKVKNEISFVNGKRNGLFKEFDKAGNLINTILYKNDTVVASNFADDDFIDLRKEFDDHGNLIFQGSFRNNIPVGIHRKYNSDGEVIESFFYDDNGILFSYGIIDDEGNRQGITTTYFLSGKIKSIGEYSDSKRIGEWKFYFENGQLEQEGIYRNGKYHGLWKWYNHNGKVIREEEYLNGKEDGLFIEYDSSMNIISKGLYVEGLKEGEWYYRVGDHTEIGKYTNGLKDGLWNYYYKNGKVQFTGKFIRDLPDGKHTYYYENGNIEEEQYYSAGNKIKTWKNYDIAGNLIVFIAYKRGIEYKINGVKIN